MAELQRAQVKRRRRRRTIPILVLVVAAAVGLAIYTGSKGSSKKTNTSSSSSTSVSSSTTVAKAATSTTTPGPTTTLPLAAGLVARTAPAISSECKTPAGGAAGTGAKPASGKQVSIVPAPAHVPFPNLNGSSPRYTKFSSAPPFCIDAAKTYKATVTTDVGPFTIELLPKYAPVTVNNFVFLAGYHFYEGITFHRVIPGFVNQVGDPTGTGEGGPGYEFKDELPSSATAYTTGAVAMANSGANTNGSQMFIVAPGGSQAGLTASYSVFGRVISGINVVDKINADGSQSGTPTVYHKILKVSISES
jgi:cyclophilin family peptidyl-prolyl cis-trans isomerase